MEKVRIATVGASGYGRIYYEQILRLVDEGKVEFKGIVIRTPAKVPAALAILQPRGVPVFSSTEELYEACRGELDLICFPTGIQDHERMMKEALAQGLDVLVEKPVSGSIDSVRRMIKTEEQSNNWVVVGFQHMAAREIHKLKRMILKGAIGELQRVSIMGIWPRDDSYYNRNNWAGKVRSDGEFVLDSPVNNAFAHFLNIGLFLAGDSFDKTARVRQASCELYRVRPVELFDVCSIRFVTGKNVSVVCQFAHTADKNCDPRIEVVGSKGRAVWKYREQAFRIETSAGAVVEERGGEPITRMFDDLVEKYSNPETFTCSLKLAGAHSYCVSLLYKHQQIHDVSRDFVLRTEPDGQYILENVAGFMTEAFERGVLLSELGTVPWAVPPVSFDAEEDLSIA